MRTPPLFVFAVWLAAALIGCTPPDKDMSIVGVDDTPTTPAVTKSTPPAKILGVRDPRGDQTGTIDVNGMLMVFDTTSGDYAIYLLAEQDRPFLGQFRANINLYDRDLGTSSQNPAFFSHTMADFNYSTPRTMIILTGWSNRLRCWKTGDRVYTNSLRYTGNPDGVTQYRSAVGSGFLSDEDTIGWQDLAQPSSIRTAGSANVSPLVLMNEDDCRKLLLAI